MQYSWVLVSSLNTCPSGFKTLLNFFPPEPYYDQHDQHDQHDHHDDHDQHDHHDHDQPSSWSSWSTRLLGLILATNSLLSTSPPSLDLIIITIIMIIIINIIIISSCFWSLWLWFWSLWLWLWYDDFDCDDGFWTLIWCDIQPDLHGLHPQAGTKTLQPECQSSLYFVNCHHNFHHRRNFLHKHNICHSHNFHHHNLFHRHRYQHLTVQQHFVFCHSILKVQNRIASKKSAYSFLGGKSHLK